MSPHNLAECCNLEIYHWGRTIRVAKCKLAVVSATGSGQSRAGKTNVELMLCEAVSQKNVQHKRSTRMRHSRYCYSRCAGANRY